VPSRSRVGPLRFSEAERERAKVRTSRPDRTLVWLVREAFLVSFLGLCLAPRSTLRIWRDLAGNKNSCFLPQEVDGEHPNGARLK